MLIEIADATIVIEKDLVRWREMDDNIDIDDYVEVLRQVDRAVRANAPDDVVASWDRACSSGRGPDADRDVDGWRVVLF